MSSNNKQFTYSSNNSRCSVSLSTIREVYKNVCSTRAMRESKCCPGPQGVSNKENVM